MTERLNNFDTRSSALFSSSVLEGAEARFRTFFESTDDCMFYVRPDANGRLVYEAINPAGMRHVALAWDQVQGRTPVEVMGPEAGGVVGESLARVFEAGTAIRYQPTMQTALGEVTFDALYSPVRDATGRVIGVLGSARDITRQREIERALHQSQKMDALGVLAGGIAHDFNNLLAGLLSCLSLLGKHVTDPAGARLLKEGLRSIERGSSLTGRLLAFSRNKKLSIESIDLTACLLELKDVLLRTLGSDVHLATELASSLWQTMVDRNEVELAVINLAINARDAMPDGGTLTLRSRDVQIVAPSGEVEPGRYVVISVADTGQGMTPQVRSRATEPFYTTKEAGKGTGLGLSIVSNLLAQLNGRMLIDSAPGAGTTIRLYFPAVVADEALEHVPSQTARE